MIKYIVVDGELNGTGLRAYYEGGYINPLELNLPEVLQQRLVIWLEKYNREHFYQFSNNEKIEELVREGLEITYEIKTVLPPDVKVQYYSAAKMKVLS